MKRTSLGIGAALGAAVAGLVATAVVYAHGGDPSRIHSCIGAQGNLRITADPTPFGNPSTACSAGEHPLDWSVTGPAGPAGPAGAAGPAGPGGPVGPRGPAGASGAVTARYVTGSGYFVGEGVRDESREIIATTLTEGIWMVFGKVVVRFEDHEGRTERLSCVIHARRGTRTVQIVDDSGIRADGPSVVWGDVALMGVVSVPSGESRRAVLICQAKGHRRPRQVLVSRPTLMAMQVNRISR